MPSEGHQMTKSINRMKAEKGYHRNQCILEFKIT